MAQIAIHQAELRRDEKFNNQNYLSISSLQTNYLNFDRDSGTGRNNQRANIVQRKCTFCGGNKHSAEKCFKRIIKDNEKARAAGHLDRQQTERPPCKYFRCGSVDHLISKCLKPPKDNKKRRKTARFN